MDDQLYELAEPLLYPCLTCTVPAGMSCMRTSSTFDTIENGQSHEFRAYMAFVQCLILDAKDNGHETKYLYELLDSVVEFRRLTGLGNFWKTAIDVARILSLTSAKPPTH